MAVTLRSKAVIDSARPHAKMIVALAAAMKAVLEHADSEVNDAEADDRLKEAFKALANGTREFSNEQELGYYLRLARWKAGGS